MNISAQYSPWFNCPQAKFATAGAFGSLTDSDAHKELLPIRTYVRLTSSANVDSLSEEVEDCITRLTLVLDMGHVMIDGVYCGIRPTSSSPSRQNPENLLPPVVMCAAAENQCYRVNEQQM
jgi:hypothetical protein